MVVAKWCKCLNVKLSLHNPPTPVTNIKWIQENTSMRKCGESKVQGNVVTMVFHDVDMLYHLFKLIFEGIGKNGAYKDGVWMAGLEMFQLQC